MKVRMYPHLEELDNMSSGIAQVVKHYFKYLPELGVILVSPQATSYDLDAGHAAARPGAMVNHNHGLLWTAEYKLGESSWRVNADLVEAARKAREITVPSDWVAQPFRRDMRLDPWIIPHGVEWDEWQHDRENLGYVLWGKNRTTDGLEPRAIVDVARAMPDIEFVCTFAPANVLPNIKVLHTAIPHEEMKMLIQQAAVVMASDRETWGILPAEAMAAGVPVLSVDSGAVPNFMPHGVAGYCYESGNLGDAIRGLRYCLKYRDRLGENGRELARQLTWERAVDQVYQVYRSALKEEPPTVDVIIPCHNYGDKLDGAIRTALEQTFDVDRVLVVDDSSSDDTEQVARRWMERDRRVSYSRRDFSNVAKARNFGIGHSDAKYIVALDADDRIGPKFVERLVGYLEEDPSLAVVYTGVRVHFPDGTMAYPSSWPYPLPEGAFKSRHKWPAPFSFEDQMRRRNQVPTCCLMRRKALVRAGGYRARYAPDGAGSEDAELFLRLGAMGWGFSFVPPERDALFEHYTGQGTVSGNKDYEESNWVIWHPWTRDDQHPFASIAEPERHSHAIRSYEKPLVSVIIPVGPGHEKDVVNALDSVEAQVFRDWEVIVVDNTGGKKLQPVLKAYPYVRLVKCPEPGAGVARNYGVYYARGMMVAFLDADDYYHPAFLQKAIDAFSQTGYVIYSDFVSKINADDHGRYGGEIIRNQGDKLLVFDAFDDYDCRRAVQRPHGTRPYVWSGVTLLLPKLWHERIGGFDEDMATWEDCDYLLRLAWAGYCFHRIPEALWCYDFTSGTRRHDSYGDESELIALLQQKYDKHERDGKIKMCGCEKTKVREPMAEANEENTLNVFYVHRNRGKHMVHGPYTQRAYGYYAGNTIIPNVYKDDIRLAPNKFICPNCREPFDIGDDDVVCPRCSGLSGTIAKGRPDDLTIDDITEEPQEPPEPVVVQTLEAIEVKQESVVTERALHPLEDLKWEKVNSHHMDLLRKSGVVTIGDVDRLGEDGLREIKGIGPATTRELVGRAKKLLE